MVKIVSRRLLGKEKVYDIGVEHDHNFVLSNGLVASNCFNKSHSTAYGYVTYQTAYLKANYPVEYMAALLTANSGDQDKVQKYISNCLMLSIQVEPPDINRSGVDFTPLQDSILFGLSAVRNVGQGAIECILAVRESGGPFKSLADLCDRIDTRVVNRRALEALIQCGAMDKLNPNRHQLIADLELILEWAQSRAKDRETGQGSLFDLFGESTASTSVAASGFDSAPKAPSVPDYPQQEKLKLEKELLGFYISDHPLRSVSKAARILSPINISELSEQRKENGMISAIILVSSVKPVVTKKGDRMAIVQLEDLTGTTEAVVFPKAYERIGSYFQADASLMIWGVVDRRDDQLQLIIEDAEPIEQVRMVMVEMPPAQASNIDNQHHLRTILLENKGEEDKAKIPVVAIVTDSVHRKFVPLGNQFRVQDHQRAISALTRAGFQARASALA